MSFFVNYQQPNETLYIYVLYQVILSLTKSEIIYSINLTLFQKLTCRVSKTCKVCNRSGLSIEIYRHKVTKLNIIN